MSRFGPPRSGNSKPSYKSKLESKYRRHRKQISRFEGMASIPLSLFQRRRTADKSTGPGEETRKICESEANRAARLGRSEGRASVACQGRLLRFWACRCSSRGGVGAFGSKGLGAGCHF